MYTKLTLKLNTQYILNILNIFNINLKGKNNNSNLQVLRVLTNFSVVFHCKLLVLEGKLKTKAFKMQRKKM